MDPFSNFLAAHKNVFLYLSLAMSVPSVVLYCAECWTIVWHKPFHNSFYGLFVVRAFTDLLYTLDSYYGYRIPNLFPGWFLLQNVPTWSLALFFFLASYTLLADNLTTGFILLNRLTAIAWPTKHENIWRKLMPPAVIAIFGVPLYAVGMLALQPVVAVEKDEAGNILSVDVTDTSSNLGFYMGLSTLGSVLFLLYCTAISLLTLFAYKRRSKVQPNKTGVNNANSRVERKLCWFAFLTFLGHSLIALLMIGLYLATMAQNTFLINLLSSQYSWVMDLGMVLLPSWLLPWASPTFRKKLLADFLPKWLHRRILGGNLVSGTTNVRASRNPLAKSLTPVS